MRLKKRVIKQQFDIDNKHELKALAGILYLTIAATLCVIGYILRLL